jgi:hypothetical protein
MTARCPHCRQIMRESYFGYMFGPRKADIMRALVHAGNLGIVPETLAMKCGNIKRKTLSAHVWQINQMMEEWRISMIDRHYVIVHVPTAADLARNLHIDAAEVKKLCEFMSSL